MWWHTREVAVNASVGWLKYQNLALTTLTGGFCRDYRINVGKLKPIMNGLWNFVRHFCYFRNFFEKLNLYYYAFHSRRSLTNLRAIWGREKEGEGRGWIFKGLEWFILISGKTTSPIENSYFFQITSKFIWKIPMTKYKFGFLFLSRTKIVSLSGNLEET